MITYSNTFIYLFSLGCFLFDLCFVHFLEQSIIHATLCFFIIALFNTSRALPCVLMCICIALEHFVYYDNLSIAFSQTFCMLSWLILAKTIINPDYTPFYYGAIIVSIITGYLFETLYMLHSVSPLYTSYKIIANIIILFILLWYIRPQVE